MNLIMSSKDFIIFHYLTKKILFSVLAIILVLSLIIFGNQFFLVLNESLKNGLFGSEILPLMFFKFLRDFPFVLSFSVVLGTIYTLNRLSLSSELMILTNSGISDLKIFQRLGSLISLFVVIVLLLSFFITPIAQFQVETFKENAKSRPDYIFFKPGIFQTFNNENITLFTSNVESSENGESQLLDTVFIYSKENDRITIAKKGVKTIEPISGNVFLKLSNGKIYDKFTYSKKNQISITSFDNFVIKLFDPSKNINTVKKDSPELKDFFLLLSEIRNNHDFAEVFYRISIPLSLIIMIILGIYISKSNPRSNKNFALGYGLILYITYYNVILFFKDLIHNESGLNIINFLLPHLIFILLIFLIHSLRNNLLNLSLKK